MFLGTHGEIGGGKRVSFKIRCTQGIIRYIHKRCVPIVRHFVMDTSRTDGKIRGGLHTIVRIKASMAEMITSSYILAYVTH